MCNVSALCNDISYPQTLMNELLLLQFKMFSCVLFSFSLMLCCNMSTSWELVITCTIFHLGGQDIFRIQGCFFPPTMFQQCQVVFSPNPGQYLQSLLRTIGRMQWNNGCFGRKVQNQQAEQVGVFCLFLFFCTMMCSGAFTDNFILKFGRIKCYLVMFFVFLTFGTSLNYWKGIPWCKD